MNGSARCSTGRIVRHIYVFVVSQSYPSDKIQNSFIVIHPKPKTAQTQIQLDIRITTVLKIFKQFSRNEIVGSRYLACLVYTLDLELSNYDLSYLFRQDLCVKIFNDPLKATSMQVNQLPQIFWFLELDWRKIVISTAQVHNLQLVCSDHQQIHLYQGGYNDIALYPHTSKLGLWQNCGGSLSIP